MKLLLIAATMTLFTSSAFARKACEELKTEIEAKLKAKGVQSFILEIVENNKVADQKVVGSCDGGSKKITYLRN